LIKIIGGFNSPFWIAITPDGTNAYVTDGVDVSLDSKKVYVVNISANSVSVVDTATNSVIKTLPVPGSGARNLAQVHITPDGKEAYVSATPAFVIDTATDTVRDPHFFYRPWFLCLYPEWH